MNEQLKATTPADILSLIPHTLGRTPRNAFVFLTIQGKRLGATIRIDAPGTADPASYATRVAHYLAADENVTATLLAVYTDTDEHPNPHIGHLEAIRRELTLAGTPLKDAWIITPTHWRGLLHDTGNQPVDAITNSQINAELIYTAATTMRTPHSMPRSPATRAPEPASGPPSGAHRWRTSTRRGRSGPGPWPERRPRIGKRPSSSSRRFTTRSSGTC